MAIRDRMKDIGFRSRAAIHIGECEKRADDLSGLAIQLASRLLDLAEAGEIIASRTVRDRVVGSGLTFEKRGEAGLIDVPGTWPFYSVSGPDF
jgi:class 3 adenylate cyclase